MNNMITLYGYLGRDAESKTLPSGNRVLNLNLATSSRRSGKEETVWWRISGWGDQFKRLEPYLTKGSALMVYGSLHYPTIYRDQEGKSQISLDVTAQHICFNPFRKNPFEEDQSVQEPTTAKQPQQGQRDSNDLSTVLKDEYAFKDDEIPF